MRCGWVMPVRQVLGCRRSRRRRARLRARRRRARPAAARRRGAAPRAAPLAGTVGIARADAPAFDDERRGPALVRVGEHAGVEQDHAAVEAARDAPRPASPCGRRRRARHRGARVLRRGSPSSVNGWQSAWPRYHVGPAVVKTGASCRRARLVDSATAPAAASASGRLRKSSGPICGCAPAGPATLEVCGELGAQCRVRAVEAEFRDQRRQARRARRPCR